MSVNVQIIFYSAYGHVHQLAEAIATGAREVSDTNVEVFQVAETLSPELVAKIHATETRKAFAHIPVADPKHLADADAIILGTPTRYGSACGQMQAFLDSTGALFAAGALVGKLGSAFTSTASQHGGQETTLLSVSTFFFHQGMLITGVPYSTPELSNISEMSGGTPYGATTIAGNKGDRRPSENELIIARAQGRHVATLAARLKK